MDVVRTPIFRTSSPTDNTSSGTTNERVRPGFGVSPNPTEGILRVTPALERATRPARYRVFDSVGRAVLSAHPDGGESVTLDVSGLAPGLYLIRREGEGGAVPFVKR